MSGLDKFICLLTMMSATSSITNRKFKCRMIDSFKSFLALFVQFLNFYSPALKKWGLYWICLVLPSFCDCHFVILSFCHSVTFQMKIFVTLFSGTVRPRRLKLGTHVDSGQMYRVYGIRLLLLICPFISSFFFLSSFQTLKFIVTLFSGTVRSRRLKLVTHVDSGQMYRVYRNQAAGDYCSLYFFIFLSLQFSNIKIFVTLFSGTVRTRRLKLGNPVDNGQI